MLPAGAPEAQRLDAFMVHSCTEFSSFPPSCTRRSCWSKSSGGSQRATKALLVTLLAFAAPLLASAQTFTCCNTGCTGGVPNNPVTCAALGDLYTATNGPSTWYNNSGWYDASGGFSCDPHQGCITSQPFLYDATVDYCKFTRRSALQYSSVGSCDSTGALTSLCVRILPCIR
jgi:hypothetical protein